MDACRVLSAPTPAEAPRKVARTPRGANSLVTGKKTGELLLFSADFGETVHKSLMIPSRSAKIPYAGEQGIFSPNRELMFPVRPKTGRSRAWRGRQFPAETGK